MGNNEMNILWISYRVPYDSVAHAGGQIHNFYLKSLVRHRDVQLKLITQSAEGLPKELDLAAYGIDYDLFYRKKGAADIFWKLCNLETRCNPWNRYAGFAYNSETVPIIGRLRKLAGSGWKPDVILLHWTQTVLLTDMAKRLFPRAKLIAIEEDVSFQAVERKAEKASPGFQRRWLQRRAKQLKAMELDALRKAALIVTNNPKDVRLLQKQQIAVPFFTWAPYFHDMTGISRHQQNNDILFYGAMQRRENSESVLWLIRNVLPLLEDLDVHLTVIGKNPPSCLTEIADERVTLTGYVKDIEPYFEKAMCFAAPLVLGAGIKVKVLEALSAGIPVLTNRVGIEGIPARDGIEYFHCETKEEYAQCIRDIYTGKRRLRPEQPKGFIRQNYCCEKDAEAFYEQLTKLV